MVQWKELVNTVCAFFIRPNHSSGPAAAYMVASKNENSYGKAANITIFKLLALAYALT